MALPIHIKLMTEPLIRLDSAALAILEHGPMHRPREIRDAKAMLVLHLRNRHHAVQHRAQAEARQEPQAVAHIDDRVTGLGPHVVPAAGVGARGGDLQAPLLREEEGQARDVGVLVVPDVGDFARALLGVAVESHARVGGAVVPMGVFVAVAADEAQGVGETG